MARVIRDGIEADIDCKTIVPGDLLIIQAGDVVPTDMIIIHQEELRVVNQKITGEPESVHLNMLQSENVFDTQNVAFCGTYCIQGEGKGLCFRA